MSEGKITLESMNQAAWYNRWTVNLFKDFLNGSILEVGCGIGNFTKLLTEYGKVHAVDIEKSYIKIAQSKAKKAFVGLGDAETGKFFFKNQLFDTVISINVLEHIKNDDAALKNIYKLLKKKGILILLVPAHPALYGQIDKAIFHYRRYNKIELQNKLSKLGFEMIKSRRLNFLGGIGWWFVGRVLKEKAVQQNRIKLFNFLGPVFLRLESFIEPPLGTSILVVAKKKQ